ncbi:MAG: hypothetical protein JWM88_1880 [Verrucomicrobia bacterium]|nr:hypothetical protein [Verrucomicrobiota bacterium]
MRLPLFAQRKVWLPTWFGAACLVVIVGGLGGLWWCEAEPFLSKTERLPAEVLVVEGWIDGTGIQSAVMEFRTGGYQVIVSAGGLTGKPWDEKRWDYSQEGEEQMLRLRIPRDQVIRATTRNKESQRTFEMAAAAWRALQARGIHPTAINVYTRSSHARRSRLVFAKVFGPDTAVGVIAWMPPGYQSESWWDSSERADDVIKETVGYLFELLLNSGRRSNSPALPK